MINRPRPFFLRKMRKEEPDIRYISRLIKNYRKGGLKEFELYIKEQMGNVPLDQIYYTDPYTKEKLVWVYVGDYWWCRKRKERYEFARMVAIRNKKDSAIEIVGLWDSRKHETRQEPVIVTHKLSNEKGYIVGWNEYEVLIEWIDNRTEDRKIATPVKEMDLLEFKFIEDFDKFEIIFNMIAKNRRR